MFGLYIEEILILACGVIVLSYLFSMLARFVRVPSVLLLLFAGIGLRALADSNDFELYLPPVLIEGLGVIGLIMIVLEAGLDLKLERSKIPLIRNSFFSALVIFIVSAGLVTSILYYWLNESVEKCLVYAIPLSIMSSTIVIPSIHPLIERKKEFLIYEASFSDILGILVFNYFTAKEVLTLTSLGVFGGNIIISIVLSLMLSFLLFLILAKTKLNIKFILILALLVLIYSGGKMMHLPSLLIILVFGLMINNWEKIPLKPLHKYFPSAQVEPLRHLMHTITAESSFLIRTFFFILFGFSIQLNSIMENDVMLIGGAIVLALFIVRILYLRFFLHTNLFPEAFFIPRGLITIVLFYKIPEASRLASFNDGILFFVILTTSIVMAAGMLFYKKRPEQIVEEGQFSERQDLM
jgi:Kef-type K+ transport system membrane component KefB